MIRYQVSPLELESVLGHLEPFAESVIGPIYDANQATEFPRAYIVPLDPNLQETCRSTSLLSSLNLDQQDQFTSLGLLAKKAIEQSCVGYKWYTNISFLFSYVLFFVLADLLFAARNFF